MSTLWDSVPSGAQNADSVRSLQPLLQAITADDLGELPDSDGTWHGYHGAGTWPSPLGFDPGGGGFGAVGQGNSPLEFPDPTVGVDVGIHLSGPGGSADGGWRVILSLPRALVRLPFLRGAEVDPQGQLKANGQNVTFTLPALRLQAKQLTGTSVSLDLLSAITSGPPVDHIDEFVSMNPPHALVGPSDVVGFAFRTAVLDLSGTAGPSGVPAGARAMPAAWQGFWLPEARLFVAPTGMTGIAVSAGVRDLWIGLGVHAGVTGIFEAEVVNRGGALAVTVGFRTAAGRSIADPGTGTAALPETCTMTVDVNGGLAPIDVSIDVGGAVTHDDRATITTLASGTTSVTVTVHDAGTGNTTRTFTVERDSTTPGGSGSSTSTPVTVTTTSVGAHRVVRDGETDTSVTVRLEPAATADWSWPGGTASGTASATVPIGATATVAVQATLTATAPTTIDAFFLYNRPQTFNANLEDLQAFALVGDNVHTQRAGSPTQPSDSATLASVLPGRLTDVGAGTKLYVQGWASYEGHDDAFHVDGNQLLSERRRDVLHRLLERAGFTNLEDRACNGALDAKNQTGIDGLPPDPAAVSGWWRARASTGTTKREVVTASCERHTITPPAAVDPKPPEQGRPDCFRKIGVRVEILRSTFIRAEVYGEFDIETAAESQLAKHGQPPLRTGPRKDADGICTFLTRLRIAEDRSSWLVSAEFRAAQADLDGLAEAKEGGSFNQTALNVLGALAVLAPLSATVADLSPAGGTLVALGTMVLGATDVLHTTRLTLRGGEIVVSQGIIAADGSTTVEPRGTAVTVMLDVEVAFTFDLGIVKVLPEHPITTRYQAVGLRSSWNTSGVAPHVDYLPVPVFDPSRGWNLDVPNGALTATPPLDELLRILGFSVSRQNPTYIEVEVGLGVDLGIVTVDTVRIRARMDPFGDVTLTKLAATIDIPGTLHGAGSLEFTSAGFKGAFDLTVIPVNIRASAVLAVESAGGVTGVLVGAEVELPVPLLLGNSGLGIYGFMGGVGVNYARNETPYAASLVKALDWVATQLSRTPSNVMHPDGWTLTPGHYAFAGGLLVGTVDGGFVVHLKGVILIEVPGPRLLLIMKADVLSLPPSLAGNQSATFLAVLDIDFGAGTITLGIVADYEIKKLLKIHIPVTAYFNAHQPQDWFVDLGSYTDRVTVSVLDVITGSGYLMVHGNGITIPGLPPVTSGMAIATGFHISCVLMGSKSIGLYLEVAAGFDAILGFDPFFVAGKIYARGELRLFIISIGASAELDVIVGRVSQDGPDITWVHGEACGEVDFFFFSVKGCVELTIGDKPPETLTPPPLVSGVKLVSRSPALVEGSATGRSVDGVIGDALKLGSAGDRPSVPLDAIPVILFDNAPILPANAVMGGTPFGQSGLGASPWRHLGDRWWAYEVQSVTLTGALQPATPPHNQTPSAWWQQAAPTDPASGPALALLDWLPTPFSRAVPYGEALTTSVTETWGTVCNPAAPPAPVLWTFDGKPIGASRTGWSLAGIPWPDPPGTLRTTAVLTLCGVSEPWRCGDNLADTVQGTLPAYIVGDAVGCGGQPGRSTAENPLGHWVKETAPTWSNAAQPMDGAAWAEAAAVLAGGVTLPDLHAVRAAAAVDPQQTKDGPTCQGRILRAPRHDSFEPSPLGTPTDQALVKEAWVATKFTASALLDAVRFAPAGGVDDLELLLLVPVEQWTGRLVLLALDEAGTIIADLALASGDRVSAANPLPMSWVDTAGPWADPVHRAGLVAARVAATATWRYELVLARFRKARGAAAVVVGWDPAKIKDREPLPFHVVAATALLASEGTRSDWDTTVTSSQQDALSTALTQDPDDHALLVPATSYQVSVRWHAASKKQDADPFTPPAPGDFAPTVTETYEFVADADGLSPTDLGPWVLASAPGQKDVGVLCDEPIRIALATQNVARLFAAYGKELRVIVHAASGKHPVPPGGTTPGAPYTIPTAYSANLQPLTSLTIRTPWEQAVLETITDAPCIAADGSRAHHDILTLPYALDPLTNYLVDVHAVPVGSAPSAVGLVHRIGFTTSAFGSVEQLAVMIRGGSTRHTVVTNPGALTALPGQPTGAQLDAAFQAAGLPTPQTPTAPSVTVLWSSADVPQPVAIVVECHEAMWRSRPMPTKVTAPPDSVDPTHQWWAARDTAWLSLVSSTAAPPPASLPAAPISRIVQGPGRTRAVVLLGGPARGTQVALDLLVAADSLAGAPEKRSLAAGIPMVSAPWEVAD